MNLDRATELAQTTDYAHEAVEEDNPINWADAGAFFLEGYLYAQKEVATRCAEIADSQTKYLSCSKDGHGIADAIRKEYGLEP